MNIVRKQKNSSSDFCYVLEKIFFVNLKRKKFKDTLFMNFNVKIKVTR